jgi:hypothetical protein
VLIVVYFAGPKVGAISYNAAHLYIGTVACVVVGFNFPSQLLISNGLVWFAHIGFDRALGYGITYSEGFNFTHLGRIGRLPSMTDNVSFDRDSPGSGRAR